MYIDFCQIIIKYYKSKNNCEKAKILIIKRKNNFIMNHNQKFIKIKDKTENKNQSRFFTAFFKKLFPPSDFGPRSQKNKN